MSLGGCFSYRVSDPVKLYKTIIGNVSGRFGRAEIRSHMQAELAACLQPALGRMAERGLRPSQLPAQVPALCETLRELMNDRWCGEHGLELVSLALDGFDAEDGDLIQSAQHAAMLQDPTMAAAALTQATAEALSEAAANGGTSK